MRSKRKQSGLVIYIITPEDKVYFVSGTPWRRFREFLHRLTQRVRFGHGDGVEKREDSH